MGDGSEALPPNPTIKIFFSCTSRTTKMAYRRTRMSRRRPIKRRYKRRTGMRRMTRPGMLRQGKVYSFKRTCRLTPYWYDGENWSAFTGGNTITNDNTVTNYAGIFKFKLYDLPQYSDFTSLYEQFKITGVKLRFIPMLGTESSALATSQTRTVAVCIDRGANDYVNAQPTFDELLANQDVKLRNSQKPFSIWIGTPTAHQPADATTQTAYVKPWLDSDIGSSVFVDHHGLKFAFQESVPTANAVYFRVYATYYIKCRNPQ